MEISVLACGSYAVVQKGPIDDADRAVMAGFRDGQVGWVMNEVAGEEEAADWYLHSVVDRGLRL